MQNVLRFCSHIGFEVAQSMHLLQMLSSHVVKVTQNTQWIQIIKVAQTNCVNHCYHTISQLQKEHQGSEMLF